MPAFISIIIISQWSLTRRSSAVVVFFFPVSLHVIPWDVIQLIDHHHNQSHVIRRSPLSDLFSSFRLYLTKLSLQLINSLNPSPRSNHAVSSWAYPEFPHRLTPENELLTINSYLSIHLSTNLSVSWPTLDNNSQPIANLFHFLSLRSDRTTADIEFSWHFRNSHLFIYTARIIVRPRLVW